MAQQVAARVFQEVDVNKVGLGITFRNGKRGGQIIITKGGVEFWDLNAKKATWSGDWTKFRNLFKREQERANA